MNDRLKTSLSQLRLSGLADTLEVRLHEAATHQLSHAEFLELILQDELLVRNERLIGRRVKAAQFRELKALDDFDWSFNPSIPRKQVFDLATCRFVREAQDVLFIGPPGTGKSFLAQAIGYLAIKQGLVVLYRSIFDVVRDFLHEEALDDQDKILTKYLKPDLLIVDDMGMRNLPRRSGDILFEIIMRRYETRSTIMTSNRPLQDWGKLIGDVPSATAILDRFLHHATILEIAGRTTYTVYDTSSLPQPGRMANNVYADFSGSGSLETRYLTGPALDQVFGQVAANGTTTWNLTDSQGSVRQVVDVNGNVLDTIDYGNITSESNASAASRFKYDGMAWDAALGLYLDHAREYDPADGDFISQDPMSFSAGESNLSEFVGNGPTDGTDPTGLRVYTIPGAPSPASWMLPIKSDLDDNTDYKTDMLGYYGDEPAGPLSMTSFDRFSVSNAVDNITSYITNDLQQNPLEDGEPVVIVGHSIGGYIGLQVSDAVGSYMTNELHYDQGVDALIMLGSRRNYEGQARRQVVDSIIALARNSACWSLLPEAQRGQLGDIAKALNVIDNIGDGDVHDLMMNALRTNIANQTNIDDIAEQLTVSSLPTAPLPSASNVGMVVNVSSPRDDYYGGANDQFSNVPNGPSSSNIIINGPDSFGPLTTHQLWPFSNDAQAIIRNYATQQSARSSWTD